MRNNRIAEEAAVQYFAGGIAMTACQQPSIASGSVANSFNKPAGGARIAVVQGSEPDDWREIYDRLAASSHHLAETLLKASSAVAVFAATASVSGLLAVTLLGWVPDISPYYLAGAVILPGLLAGAAAGQTAGNLFLRLWYGLGTEARRGFATRLSLARCPRDWPGYLKRWLFTGDWVGSPSHDLRFPYVRMYIEGEAPSSCAEEDALWREVHGYISGDSLWEAGTNIREISYPKELPAWARQIENGDGFSDLRARIGERAASEWIMHIRRRACRMWPELGANDCPGQARKECFEMHSVPLADGRDALVVVLRPVSFIARTKEIREEDSLAA